MRNLFFTFGLLTCICICNAAYAKVQLYKPTVLKDSPDGYIKIEFEGTTEPNTRISINPEGSLIIQSRYKLTKTEVPASLKSFSDEFRKNIRNKREGVFRIKSGCTLYSSAKKKSKVITKLKKEALLFAQSESKKWMKVSYSNKNRYVKKSCLNRPKIRGLRLSPSAKSDSKGNFKLVSTLPEGNIQLLFSVKKKTPSSHLFVLDVRETKVSSNTKFAKRPPKPKKKKLAKKTDEPKAVPLVWGFKAELGIGYNFHDLSQEVGQASNIEFSNNTLPSISFDLTGKSNHFEAELSYSDASNELKEAKAPYTLVTSDYSLTSLGLIGRYYLDPLPQNSSTGYVLGYLHKTVPLFLVDVSNNVDAGDMGLNFLNFGFVTRQELTDDFSYPWELSLLIPVSSDSSVGDGNEIDAKLSANFKFAAQRFWYDNLYYLTELNLDYIVADYSYTSGVTDRKGQVSLLSTQIDFKLGMNF